MEIGIRNIVGGKKNVNKKKINVFSVEGVIR